MTKVILISGGNLDSFYEQSLQYLDDKYHNYPSHFGPPSPGEQAAIEQNENAIASGGAIQNNNPKVKTPIGKRVV